MNVYFIELTGTPIKSVAPGGVGPLYGAVEVDAKTKDRELRIFVDVEAEDEAEAVYALVDFYTDIWVHSVTEVKWVM